MSSDAERHEMVPGMHFSPSQLGYCVQGGCVMPMKQHLPGLSLDEANTVQESILHEGVCVLHLQMTMQTLCGPWHHARTVS